MNRVHHEGRRTGDNARRIPLFLTINTKILINLENWTKENSMTKSTTVTPQIVILVFFNSQPIDGRPRNAHVVFTEDTS